MLRCQICCVEPQTQLLTKCCKLFICDTCRQKYQKSGVCICGKNVINKKLCNPNPQLFEIVKNYYEGRPQECDRCDNFAEIQCFDCNMIYCESCNLEVHNAKGFAKHNRDPCFKQQKSYKKTIQKAKKKQQLCFQHKLNLESVCECGSLLCASCLKSHKQSCNKVSKPRPIKQYKQEYFSQILFKMKQITQYKQKLKQDKKQYTSHFAVQKQTYESYSKLIDEQFEGIKRILEMKIGEVKNRLNEYWKQCLNAYNKTQYYIDHHLKKFDDYGRLSQRFVEKIIGYDYLQKRVKRVYFNEQFFNFKVQGVEDVQFAIINISSIFKNWELNQQDKILFNFDQQKIQKDKQKKTQQIHANPVNATSQLLLQCSQNPLLNRPLVLKSSHNQISFQFLHLPHQNQTYQVQYGVGLKMKGQQVFKKIQNRNGIGIINNLNPSTKYRVRMRVSSGEFGPITEIKTQQTPKFVAQLCPTSKHYPQNPLQILKAGVVYGSNEILFGTHSWQIRIFPPKHNDEQTACISVGVSNKQQKKPVFVGTTLNYGYQKALIIVKITLNCDQNRMVISNSTSNQDEIYQNLPNFPIYPTIQNKGSNPVQIQCTFN